MRHRIPSPRTDQPRRAALITSVIDTSGWSERRPAPDRSQDHVTTRLLFLIVTVTSSGLCDVDAASGGALANLTVQVLEAVH
jgi:hypothetical protein